MDELPLPSSTKKSVCFQDFPYEQHEAEPASPAASAVSEELPPPLPSPPPPQPGTSEEIAQSPIPFITSPTDAKFFPFEKLSRSYSVAKGFE